MASVMTDSLFISLIQLALVLSVVLPCLVGLATAQPVPFSPSNELEKHTDWMIITPKISQYELICEYLGLDSEKKVSDRLDYLNPMNIIRGMKASKQDSPSTMGYFSYANLPPVHAPKAEHHTSPGLAMIGSMIENTLAEWHGSKPRKKSNPIFIMKSL